MTRTPTRTGTSRRSTSWRPRRPGSWPTRRQWVPDQRPLEFRRRPDGEGRRTVHSLGASQAEEGRSEDHQEGEGSSEDHQEGEGSMTTTTVLNIQHDDNTV